jgi:hypothetical protein
MATRITSAPLAIKVQSWGDDLRLPTVMESAAALILGTTEPLRRPSIPLQSKHLPALKRNIWYALRRPADKSRTGLLCVLPSEHCCVYVSGEPLSHRKPTQRIALLRLRVDPQFLAPGVGPTVFAATLSATSRKLWVEDVILWKGRAVGEEEPFRKRWELAAQWLENYCMMDPRLLDGLDVEMANWQALEDIEPSGVWDIIQDQHGTRRLLWIATKASIELTPVAPAPGPAPGVNELPAVPVLDVAEGPRVAVAVKESGPDQWALKSADGVSLGRALVRTLTVSSALRSSAAGHTGPRVEVSWNTVFKKWEIVAMSLAPAASHSSVFQV